MNEGIVLAVVAFFSAVVMFSTAVVGYFKVLKPSRENNKRVDTVVNKVEIYEQRIKSFEERCNLYEQQITLLKSEQIKLTERVAECESARKQLETRNQWLQDQLSMGGE